MIVLQNEAPSELSDPEDDILPPPMGPISGHSPLYDTSSTPKSQLTTSTASKERGFRPGPAGAPSVDSAVESWEGSIADTQRTKSSVGKRSNVAVLLLSCSNQLFVARDNFNK